METKKNTSISDDGSSQYTDPTYNVLQLVHAAVERLNDITSLTGDNFKEIIGLNKEILNLHVVYGEKLSNAESKRIDAIRAVDVQAAALGEERARNQALMLANQVKQAEDNSRNLVTLTADTLRSQVITPLIDRIANIEKAQYESKGTGHGKDEGKQSVYEIIKLIIIVAGFILGYFMIKK